MNQYTIKWCGYFVLVCTIVGVGLYGGSFKTLGPNDAGLMYNTITKQVTLTKIYTPGRYFLGLGRDFIKFPTGLQTIEWAGGASTGLKCSDGCLMSVSTVDGLSMYLEVSFQFRLDIS